MLARNQMVSAVFEFKPVGYIFWLMKRVWKIAIYLASGLALNASLQADDVSLPNNPYAPIVAHNMFGLNPPQAADALAADANPPPKITLTGIMTIFGSRQALFTVDVAGKPEQSGKNGSFILGEGQRQNDIEVTRINEKSGVVTFNNHGVVQEIPLTKAQAITASTTPITSITPTMPIAVGSRPFGNHPGPPNGGSLNLQAIPMPGGGPTQQSQQSQSTLTPEAQIVGMEVNRQLTADQVIKGELPPLPPTPLTPDDPPMPPIPGR